ncbi:MAG: hypothetical protein QCH99_03855 [Candidatus Bathyarchaeota archaeon]|nr:hypothetical protein [Candidatus Bathyarchaeum tardum]
MSFSKNLKKYFQCSSFFAKYDVTLQNVGLSILNVPVIADIIPLAWAVGADIFVKELDKNFLSSLETVKTVMRKWYPDFSFSTTFHIDNQVTNFYPQTNNALLFSGGLDSICSYVACKNKKPILILIWGGDIPLAEKQFWVKVKQKYKKFADRENSQLHIIKSNSRELLNEKNLVADFGKFCTGNSWWGAVQHGFSSLGLCAPIARTENLGKIFIASSVNPVSLKNGGIWGSHPLIDNNISWGPTKIVHHGDEFSRQEKIRFVLKPYIERDGNYPFLRVCYSQFKKLNCGKCEKCLRTITGLVWEDIDPNACGFKIDNDCFNFLKKFLVTNLPVIQSHSNTAMWLDVQSHIPDNVSVDMYNSKEFFEWFRNFNLSKKSKPKKSKYRVNYILNSFDSLKSIVSKIFYF